MKEQLLKLQEVFTKAKGVSIELGLVDDLDKINSEVFKKSTSLYNEMLKASNTLKSVSKEYKTLAKKWKEAINVGSKLEKAVKDLGIDMPSESKKTITSLKNFSSAVEQNSKNSEKAATISKPKI